MASKEELEKILKQNKVWLGAQSNERENREAFVKDYMETENYYASIVESGFCNFGPKGAVSETNENVYLSYKPERLNERIDGGMVNTDSISRPRYDLVDLTEENGQVTLKYQKGDETYQKVFKPETETRQVSETKLKRLTE